MTVSALSLLQDGELCTVTTSSGEREAAWNPYDWCFVFTDNQQVCPVADVVEWVAGARF